MLLLQQLGLHIKKDIIRGCSLYIINYFRWKKLEHIKYMLWLCKIRMFVNYCINSGLIYLLKIFLTLFVSSFVAAEIHWRGYFRQSLSRFESAIVWYGRRSIFWKFFKVWIYSHSFLISFSLSVSHGTTTYLIQ